MIHDRRTCPMPNCPRCAQIRGVVHALMHHPHERRKGMGFNRQESDPVLWADMWTTRADCRAALSLALGYPVAGIDSCGGWVLAQAEGREHTSLPLGDDDELIRSVCAEHGHPPATPCSWRGAPATFCRCGNRIYQGHLAFPWTIECLWCFLGRHGDCRGRYVAESKVCDEGVVGCACGCTVGVRAELTLFELAANPGPAPERAG